MKDMGAVSDKLRDVESFLFCHDKSELAIEVVNILANCDSLVLQTKIKNLKQASIETYFKKMQLLHDVIWQVIV
jgi:hypothetical protein